jgi:uncharacterized membrane protein YczE
VALFLLALGVAISVNGNLGVSPVNSLPYIISQIINVPMGTCVTALFCFYILLQIIILRREFQPIQLLQIVFSTVFGYFVDFAKLLIGDFVIPTYFGRLTMLGISIVLIAVGSPIWLSLLIAAAAVVLALYVVLWAVLISLWAVFVALAACAVAGSLAGIVCAVGGYGYAGCFLEAAALVCGGLAILFGYGCNALSKGTVRLTHWLVVGRKHRYTKKESM